MNSKKLLSGMRPTGRLHIGHLVGALNNWVKLQEDYKCLFMVADWHALMSEYAQPSVINENIYNCVVDWISCGIDPAKSIMFLQSDVREHLDLFMIMSNITPLGWLERCPTYKEQLRELKTRNLHTYAFLGYPVLQAADILLYKAEIVPIGKDQLPHLELTREIVRKFAHLYKAIFPEPKPLLTSTPKLLGIDGRKMSKSFDNYIALSDDDDIIVEKIKKMFTDPKRVKLSDRGHPDKCNVCAYYKIFASEKGEEIVESCRNAKKGCTDCKKKLADIIIERLGDIRRKRKEILSDKTIVEKVLREGAQKAGNLASKTMKDVYDAMGIK